MASLLQAMNHKKEMSLPLLEYLVPTTHTRDVPSRSNDRNRVEMIGFNLTKQQAWSCSRFKFILRYKEIVKRNENGLVLILDS